MRNYYILDTIPNSLIYIKSLEHLSTQELDAIIDLSDLREAIAMLKDREVRSQLTQLPNQAFLRRDGSIRKCSLQNYKALSLVAQHSHKCRGQ